MAEIVVKLVNGELAGKTAQSIAKEVNAAALALKKAEVGTKEWVKANENLTKAKQLQTDLKKQIEGTAEASDFLKKSWNALPGAQFFNQIGDSFGFMKKGVGGLISQFGMLKVAIASTGIGLLVLALGSLIAYFQSTQEGIDKITAVTRPLKAIFDALVGVLQNLGGKVFKQLAKAVEDPKQAFKDLGDFIVNNIINRFKAIALLGPAIQKIFSKDWKEGLKDLGNAALQAVTGVEDVIGKVVEGAKQLAAVVDEAYQKGKRMDELQKQIERAEINQITRSKQLELLIKQQKDIVEDVTKSWDERKQAAQNALDAQQALLASELALLDKRIEKMRIEQTLNDTSREQEKELAELIAKRFELQARTTEQQIEFKKKLAEFDKAAAQQEAATIKNIEDLRVEAMQEGLEKEIEAINLATERKIEALTGSAAQIAEQEALMETIRQQNIQAIRDRYAEEQKAKDEKAKEEQRKRDEKAAEDKRKLLEQQAAFEREMDDLTRDLAMETNDFIIDIAGKAGLKSKELQKASGVLDIGINLQKELSANAVAAAANPLNGTTFGAAGAAQLVKMNTASLIRAAIGTARVLAFREGGIPGMVRDMKMRPGVLRGPSHEAGGIPLVAEGDEIILTKGVYRNQALRRAASMINVLGGGREFAAGGPTNPLPRQSFGNSSFTQPEVSIIDYKQLGAVLKESMKDEIYKIQVSNNLQDTRNGLQTLNDLQSEADL